MFMMIAENPALSDASTYSYLPAAYNTLYQLVRIEPMECLLDAIDVGLVSPGMTSALLVFLSLPYGRVEIDDQIPWLEKTTAARLRRSLQSFRC
jgi:hypothetical protein